MRFFMKKKYTRRSLKAFVINEVFRSVIGFVADRCPFHCPEAGGRGINTLP